MTWPTKKLGEVCDILDSKRKPVTKKNRKSGPYPYYGATGVQDYVADYIFDEPLVLVGEDGAKWGAGEETAYGVEGKCWVNNHAHVLRPHREILLDGWLVYFLNTSDLSDYITGLTVKKLNQEKLRNIEIPLPPLSEQKRIVEKIEKLFAKIDGAEKLRAESSATSATLLPSALHQVFSCAEKEGWKEKTLGELFEITSSKRVFKSEWKESGVPFYRARELVSLANKKPFKSPIFISEKMYKEYKSKYGVPKEGDVLVTGVGTLGVSYVVKSNDKFYFKDGNIIWLKKISDINSRFVEYFFKSSALKDHLRLNSGSATVVGTFTITTAKSTEIPLPPIAEQKKIVAYLDSFSTKARELQNFQTQTAADFSALKRSVLSKSFKSHP